ncbi:MAG TPA: glycerol-3-phosphate dehydrogenase/oxidase [bacterium]|nr:glycerol-3-phosphate dehydrogenase/oxidase [bacterium]
MKEFSFRTRKEAFRRFQDEVFDLLIIGGGITGAGTARDAASRGLKVALVEARDFAWGTSSRSSKLIHGGLRYLQNMEFGLVFEALSERSHLLKTVPHMVRPLPFFMPVYRGDKPGKFLLNVGLWLYDLLALGRAPGFHRTFSKKKFLEQVPFLKEEGLKGGFRYFDASMWDDVLAVETLRAAQEAGAAVANYAEAVAALWENEQVKGFEVRDLESASAGTIPLRAKRTVVCAGPWTDQVGIKISSHWRRWLNPSKGVHLIFDLKRIPVPGAIVMSHPEDGRISFVIPRPDYGAGVVIVGTTDGPTPLEPEKAAIEPADVNYLMDLLNRYFPALHLKPSDILSAYVGVRPLMGAQASTAGSEGTAPRATAADLQKVSREHYIGPGPGGVILVAGGKYTTHRLMAREIVDVALARWREDAAQGRAEALPGTIGASHTEGPVNPMAAREAVSESRRTAAERGWDVPEALWNRFGAEALEIFALHRAQPDEVPELEGFPFLGAQLRYEMRNGMVVRLEDFYLRRSGLYPTRKDHGLPAASALARIWAEERGLPPSAAAGEVLRLQGEVQDRNRWQQKLS